MTGKPTLFTCLSPSMLHLYDLDNCVVVIIDVFRATSTIAAALYNGATRVIPVDSVRGAIDIGTEMGCITAGERDGKIAEGLQYGNSPLEYPGEFIKDKTLVLTTTNGTKLLHMALQKGASEVITGSFPNLSAVCAHLISSGKNVLLGCSAWKDRVNMEDTIFAGAVVAKIKDAFEINCDSSQIALTLYNNSKNDMYAFMKAHDASHYHRLTNFGLEKDIRHCLTPDLANVLPEYVNGKLVVQRS